MDSFRRMSRLSWQGGSGNQFRSGGAEHLIIRINAWYRGSCEYSGEDFGRLPEVEASKLASDINIDDIDTGNL